MRKVYVTILLISLLFSVTSFKVETQLTNPPKKAKYIFLLIGDGMGLNQVFITNQYLKDTKQAQLFFPTLPFFALTETFCSDSCKITDSAAAGTAIASGNKTKTGAIGINPSNNEKYNSIAVLLKNNNFKIGIISSVALNHATPAAFYGHQFSRNSYDLLVDDLGKSNFDFFAGGGIMTDATENIENGRNSQYSKISESGYELIFDPAKFSTISKDYTGKKVFLCDKKNLKNGEAFQFVIDKPNQINMLADYVKIGTEFLNNQNGFFIMTEGGKVDWACHSNDGATAIYEVIAFDKAVKEAFDFYEKHKDETLIIVTADHETGGMSFGYKKSKYDTHFSFLKNQKISVESLVDSLSNSSEDKYGYFAEKYFGINKNELTFPNNNAEDCAYYIVDKFNKNASVGWTTNAHTGTPIGTFAIGVGAEFFTGIIDNTEIITGILKAVQLSK